MNTLKTVFLMTFMTVLLLIVGSLVGGGQGMMIAFVVSLLMNFASYWFSDKIVLMMYRAREVTQSEAPKLYGIVARVASQVQLPMPKIYIIPGESPNAFATGRDPQHAAVAATEGIVALLGDDELEGVIAHEFSHIKHRDILTGSITAAMVGAITMIARMAGWSMMFAGGRSDRRDSNGIGELVLLILAPIAAVIVQLAISRSREFAADEGAAHVTGRPLSLANALQKLEQKNEQLSLDHASPATAHMFIVNPLHGGGVMKLFSTHPPISERIERLQKIAMGSL
ncbi:MAG TPA: zinc metalloprotease HtpX [Bacteroidota bacterium]|jgi:heat shock protein HtpX|nr:zinc metalloprotease HtpX [Bacteroidota bacterium]